MNTPKRPAQSGAERSRQRVQRPGEAGLANEKRPGLGTRSEKEQQLPPKPKAAETAPPIDERARLPKPPLDRPAPQEQDPASLAHEYERATGMSGQTGGV